MSAIEQAPSGAVPVHRGSTEFPHHHLSSIDELKSQKFSAEEIHLIDTDGAAGNPKIVDNLKSPRSNPRSGAPSPVVTPRTKARNAESANSRAVNLPGDKTSSVVNNTAISKGKRPSKDGSRMSSFLNAASAAMSAAIHGKNDAKIQPDTEIKSERIGGAASKVPTSSRAVSARIKPSSKIISSAPERVKSGDSATSSTLDLNKSVDPFVTTSASDSHVDENSLECKICKVSFTSLALLQKHVKFSQVHATSLANLTKVVVLEVRRIRLKAIESHDSVPVRRWKIAIFKVLKQNMCYGFIDKLCRMDLGTRLMKSKAYFQGYKNMWRTQDNITYDMYYHWDERPTDDSKPYYISHNPIIEVIGYDPITEQELPRLYFDEPTIAAHVKEDVAAELAKHKIISDGAEAKTIKKLTAELIFSRIEPELTIDSDQKKIFSTRVHSSGEKNVAAAVIAEENPMIRYLKPVKISRRRRSTHAEMTAKIEEVMSGITSLVTSARAAEGMTTVLGAAKQ